MQEIEVCPDWQVVRTAAEAESYFTNDFKFKGPGWYYSLGDSMLVYPVGDHAAPFKSTWSEDQQFRFLVYSGRDPVESLRESALAPIRKS